ncbi:MAG TPA: MFS transporter, partial [Arthrobacter sp.]|nr:MFS transporter [Arthrobacter sp.]
MSSRSVQYVQQPGGSAHVVWAIIALAAGGFGIGTTEFAIMGLLQDVA